MDALPDSGGEVIGTDEMVMVGLFVLERIRYGAILCTTAMEPRRIYRFDGVTVDVETMRVCRDGRDVALEPKSIYLLEFLIRNRNRVVSKEEIFQVIWKGVVVTDNALTRAITQIRKALNDDPRNPRFIETVPTVGYRFTAALEPDDAPALVNRTAESAEVVRRGWTAGKSVRIVLFVGCICIALAAAGGWLAHSTRATQAIQAMAVLPLENLSGDAAQDYFAAGTTDELITQLARIPNLRVASLNSLKQSREKKPLREIAQELHVDAVVEGSVLRSGDQVRINARLVDVRNDRHLWAQSFEGTVDNVLVLEDEVAREIASHAKLALAPTTVVSPGATRKVNPAAHDAYLRGRYLWWAKTEESGKYFRKAVELQPDYALGWSGVALYYVAGAIGGGIDPRVAVPQLKSAALRSVELDDSLPEAHLTLGMAYLCEWNLQASKREIDRAIQLNPSFAEAYYERARVDFALNRNAEAIQDGRTAMDLDPFDRTWGMVTVLRFARQYDAAIQEAQVRLEADPNDEGVYWELGQVYDLKGDAAGTARAWAKMELLEGDKVSVAIIRTSYERGGRIGFIKEEIVQDTKNSASGYVSPVVFAHLYAQLGEREKALGSLEEAYNQRSPQLLWIQTDPSFDFLHEDVRYQALIRGVGLPSSS